MALHPLYTLLDSGMTAKDLQKDLEEGKIHVMKDNINSVVKSLTHEDDKLMAETDEGPKEVMLGDLYVDGGAHKYAMASFLDLLPKPKAKNHKDEPETPKTKTAPHK